MEKIGIWRRVARVKGLCLDFLRIVAGASVGFHASRGFVAAKGKYLLSRSLLVPLLIAITLFSTPAAPAEKEIAIGVLADQGVKQSLAHWRATADFLSEKVDGYTFRLMPFADPDELALAAQRGEFDFAITNPASYVQMEVEAGAEAIASLVHSWRGKPINAFGSVVFTRSDRTELTTLHDLRGKTLMAVEKRDFAGWLIVLGEFHQHGIDHEKLLQRLVFEGGNQENVVLAVRDGKVDAGVVRTGILEKMARDGTIDLDDFRVLENRDNLGFPFLVSSDLFEEWAFARLPGAQEKLPALVRRLLLGIDPQSKAAVSGGYRGWIPGGHYWATKELLETVSAPPFTDHEELIFRRALWENRFWILAISIAVSGLLASLVLAWKRGIDLLRVRDNLLELTALELNFQKRALDEHAIVTMSDLEGNITYVNDKFVEISGYTRPELVGTNHRQYRSREHSEKFFRELWQTVANGKPWHGELKNLNKSGKAYWVEATVVPDSDEPGKSVRCVSILTDITSVKAAEGQRQLRQSLELIEDEVYTFRPDTLEILYVNRAGRRRFGMSGQDWRGRRIGELIPEKSLARLREKCALLRCGSDKKTTYEVLDTKTGPIEITLQLVCPEDEVPRFVAFYRNINDRKVAEQAKSEFISTVSHELRTPMTSIKGALGLLLAGVAGDLPDKAKSLIGIAHKNSDRMVLLINDILDLEKTEAGKMDFSMAPVDLSVLLKEAIESNKPYGCDRGISFALSGADRPVLVNGDHDRLMQVMDNLMSNAAKFSHPGGTVEMSLTLDTSQARISVRDFGRGIPEDAKSRIFDKFTQADTSDRRRFGGTGLGLNIAKSIVERHGGAIGFTSRIDKGSTFYFDLEMLRADDGEMPVAAPQSKTPNRIPEHENGSDVASPAG